MAVTTPTLNTTPLDDPLDAAFLKRMGRLHLAQPGHVASDFRGRRRALGVGHGVDFADHRPYQRGDELRHVDWKAYARSGRMLLRRFEPQGRARIAILVDGSASMAIDQGSKLRLAQRVAATLTHGALQRGDQVTLWMLHEGTATPSPSFHTPAQRHDAFEFLRDLRAAGGTNLAGAAHDFATRQASRSLTVLISDLVDATGYRTAVQQLKTVSQQCHVIQVCAAHEDAGLDLGAVELVDSEDGNRLQAVITPHVNARYRETYQQEQLHMVHHFRSRGIPYARLSAAEPIERAIVALRRARVVEA